MFEEIEKLIQNWYRNRKEKKTLLLKQKEDARLAEIQRQKDQEEKDRLFEIERQKFLANQALEKIEHAKRVEAQRKQVEDFYKRQGKGEIFPNPLTVGKPSWYNPTQQDLDAERHRLLAMKQQDLDAERHRLAQINAGRTSEDHFKYREMYLSNPRLNGIIQEVAT